MTMPTYTINGITNDTDDVTVLAEHTDKTKRALRVHIGSRIGTRERGQTALRKYTLNSLIWYVTGEPKVQPYVGVHSHDAPSKADFVEEIARMFGLEDMVRKVSIHRGYIPGDEDGTTPDYDNLPPFSSSDLKVLASGVDQLTDLRPYSSARKRAKAE